MREERTNIILSALLSAQGYLYDNLDIICDNDYFEETKRVLSEIESAIELVKKSGLSE
ncbi:MAG: hypothetical protein J6M19_04470 [Bacteroidaceae bacterium]|nr:hypothetical protein [Bacteroidaceae bacterium]